MASRCCPHCGHEHDEPPRPAPRGMAWLAVCPRCMRISATVRTGTPGMSLGEMQRPDEKADPKDWGGLGWQ